MKMWTVALLVLACAVGADDVAKSAALQPVDFAAIERKVAKQPELTSPKPLYGLFLFGLQADKKVWAVFDKSAADAQTYDVLYLDRNADGDLTGKDERFAGTVSKGYAGMQAVFDIGAFTDPGSGAVHTKFKVTYTPASVRYRMLWRGEKVTMGAYGPQRETYAKFGETLATAPVLVPGYDRPFAFEHWMSGTLQRGGSTDFKVFIGNRGSRRGAFSCVDDKFLPAGEYVLATLIYTDGRGKKQRHQAKLTSRC